MQLGCRRQDHLAQLRSKLVFPVPQSIVGLLGSGVDVAPGGGVVGEEREVLLGHAPEDDGLILPGLGLLDDPVGSLQVGNCRAVGLFCVRWYWQMLRLLGQPAQVPNCRAVLFLLLGGGDVFVGLTLKEAD